MPQRRQQDPRRIGQLAQYHPGGGDLRSRGRSQGPLTGDPSVTAPTERTAPAQQSPLFAGGPGEQPPQLERAAPVDTPLAGEGLMAPGFGGDTDMRTRPAPTAGGEPTSVRSDPGLQAPIPPPIPEPMGMSQEQSRNLLNTANTVTERRGPTTPSPRPPYPPIRRTAPRPPIRPSIGMLPPRPGYRPAPEPPPRPPQGWPSDIHSPGPPPGPGAPGRGQQQDIDSLLPMLQQYSEAAAQAGQGYGNRGQQRERDMQRAQRRDARRARPLRA